MLACDRRQLMLSPAVPVSLPVVVEAVVVQQQVVMAQGPLLPLLVTIAVLGIPIRRIIN